MGKLRRGWLARFAGATPDGELLRVGPETQVRFEDPAGGAGDLFV